MILGLVICTAGFAWWWFNLPRTGEELFQVRCSTCHELRSTRLCEFAPELRPAIVQVMRRQHGADEVIDINEAVLIENYLREEFKCR